MINCGIVTVLYNHNESDVYNWFQTLIHNFFYLSIFNFEIYLINNGKVDYNFEPFNNEYISSNYPKAHYNIHYIKCDQNVGYCGGNNLILKELPLSKAECLFIINPDVFIYNSLVFDWMYSISKEKNAITGLLQNGKDWLVYPAMFPVDKRYDVDNLPFAYNYNPQKKHPFQTWKSLPYIDGSLMCMPYSVFYNTKGFDTEFFPGYFGETAFQFDVQINHNVKLLHCPVKKFIDHKCKSDEQFGIEHKKEWTEKGRLLFYKKYALPNYDKFLSLLV